MRGLLPAFAVLIGLTSRAVANSPVDTLPPKTRARAQCSIAAAVEYQVPANIMLAVADMEGGRAGQWVRNDNGTFDVGPMQLNTRYLAHLEERYGITPAQASAPGCGPFRLAAWRLRRHLSRDKGDIWTRAANYHSTTPRHNHKYQRKLRRLAGKWRRWLEKHYRTFEATKAAPLTARTHHEPASGDSNTSGLAGSDASLVRSMQLLTGRHPWQTNEWRSPANSKSIGRADAGRLDNGRQLPPHSRYRIRNPRRAWGTGAVIEWVQAAFDQAPPGPAVAVHDLSRPRGGRMSDHRSHQSGRDVDIAYYQHHCRGTCRFRTLDPSQLDAARQWPLLRYWLKRGVVELILVDYDLQQPLYIAAKAAGTSPDDLRKWFQYPGGAQRPGGIIRHEKNHRDHFHVRFRCTAEDSACKETRAGLGKLPTTFEVPRTPVLDLLDGPDNPFAHSVGGLL